MLRDGKVTTGTDTALIKAYGKSIEKYVLVLSIFSRAMVNFEKQLKRQLNLFVL